MIQKRPTASDNQYPACPNCGSEASSRIGDAVLPNQQEYCSKESGHFRCEHCQEIYMFLKAIETEQETEQEFSPQAMCPACKSYKTAIVKTASFKRYHLCLNPKCRNSFKTTRPQEERRVRAQLTSIKSLLNNIESK